MIILNSSVRCMPLTWHVMHIWQIEATGANLARADLSCMSLLFCEIASPWTIVPVATINEDFSVKPHLRRLPSKLLSMSKCNGGHCYLCNFIFVIAMCWRILDPELSQLWLWSSVTKCGQCSDSQLHATIFADSVNIAGTSWDLWTICMQKMITTNDTTTCNRIQQRFRNCLLSTWASKLMRYRMRKGSFALDQSMRVFDNWN